MKEKKHIVKSLNMGGGEILTLDKAMDRVEFEALVVSIKGNGNDCVFYCECKNGTLCSCNTDNPPCVPACCLGERG